MNMEKLKNFFKDDTLAVTMGIQIVSASFEKAVCTMTVSDDFLLADFTFAVASNLGGKLSVTLDASVTYFRPAKDRKLVATAKLVSYTKHTCNYNIEVVDGENRLIAVVSMNGYRNDIDINFD